MQEWYHGWWWRTRRMSRRQIQEMIKNMGKSWIISEKSKQYHQKEEQEADEILKKLDENNK